MITCGTLFPAESFAGLCSGRIKLFSRDRFVWPALESFVEQFIDEGSGKPIIQLKTALNPRDDLLIKRAEVCDRFAFQLRMQVRRNVLQCDVRHIQTVAENKIEGRSFFS